MSRKILFLILLGAVLVNLLGAFGPELGFDALWYHLTIPKIYLMWAKIDFIPGGLMYYSAMPRFGEMVYLGSLGWLGEIGPHLINWGAGIGAAILTYKIARKVGLSAFYSLLSALVFYATPLVGWQSGSAYVDIIRTFFEALAFWFFIQKKPIATGVAVGLAISTKTLGLGSLGILGVLGVGGGRGIRGTLKMLITAIGISGPWFWWAYAKTGFPFYPIGAGILDETHRLGGLGGFGMVRGIEGLMQDLTSPIYLIVLPFIFLVWRKLNKQVLFYSLLTFIVWWLTPPTGGGRFLLPYLPVMAVGGAQIMREMGEMRGIGGIRGLMIGTTIIVAVVSIGYRFAANAKILPYLAREQTKTEYLCQHLDFSTRVFVDCDGSWAKKVKPEQTVLVKGFHNLYYVSFPFIHETWYKGEKVDYILDYDEWKKSRP